MTPSAADSIQARAIRFQPSTQVALGLSECPRTVSTMDSETQALASPPPSHYRLQPRPSATGPSWLRASWPFSEESSPSSDSTCISKASNTSTSLWEGLSREDQAYYCWETPEAGKQYSPTSCYMRSWTLASSAPYCPTTLFPKMFKLE